METQPSKDLPAAEGSNPQAAATAQNHQANLKLLRLALILTILSLLLFVVGIFSPATTMVPSVGGGWRQWFVTRFLRYDLTPQTFSIASGVFALLKGGDFLLATIIFLFSIVFPLLKLIALLGFAYQGSTGRRHSIALAWMTQLGKWSMLDVFVVGVIVVSSKGFPGGTRIEPNWGLYVFACSVVLSMLAAATLKAALPPVESS